MKNLTNKQHFFSALIDAVSRAFWRLEDGTEAKFIIHTRGDKELFTTQDGVQYEGDEVDAVDQKKYQSWKGRTDDHKEQASDYVECCGDRIFQDFLAKRGNNVHN